MTWRASCLLALLACGAVVPLKTRPAPPSSRPVSVHPNVVLIVLDDVGLPEVPLLPSLFDSLDGLASKGVSFTRATSWPVCSITRVALMTGRLPRREGIGDLEMAAMSVGTKRLRLSLNTIGEVFAPSYATAYFGKWHIGRAALDVGMGMGLSALEQARVQAPLGPFVSGFEYAMAVNPDVPTSGSMALGFYKWWCGNMGSLTLSFTYAVDVQRDAFLTWWGTPATEPRMAWLCWSAVHGSGPDVYEIPPGGVDQPTTRGDYEQGVAYLDAQLATVLAAIDLETTVVIVTSDNGTPDDARPLGTASGMWKHTTYEGGVSVPLVIAGPGIEQGVESSRLVSLVDLPATMAELAGLELMPGFEDSQSFADELGSSWRGTPARSWVFTEHYHATYDDQAVIEGVWKLRRVDPDGAGPMASKDGFMKHPGDQPLQPPDAVKSRLLAELASVPARQ